MKQKISKQDERIFIKILCNLVKDGKLLPYSYIHLLTRIYKYPKASRAEVCDMMVNDKILESWQVAQNYISTLIGFGVVENVHVGKVKVCKKYLK